MKDVAALLNEMVADGVISDYAVFGAMAQMRYTDAVATMDADILVAAPEPARIDVLSTIYAFCRRKGFVEEGECVRVGAWPVQFVPAFNALTEEALAHAEEDEIDGVPVRVVSADYLAVIALETGRAKDHARIVALTESAALDLGHVAELAGKHSLATLWESFGEKYLDA
jgi:hypothetical protein